MKTLILIFVILTFKKVYSSCVCTPQTPCCCDPPPPRCCANSPCPPPEPCPGPPPEPQCCGKLQMDPDAKVEQSEDQQDETNDLNGHDVKKRDICDDTPQLCGVSIYPNPGKWFLHTPSNKYYFKCGNILYTERKDHLYSKWSSPNNWNWDLTDAYLWTWDSYGSWYPFKKDKTDVIIRGIPFKCLNNECPKIIRFPSRGVWYKHPNSTHIYKEGQRKFVETFGGYYKKYMKHGNTYVKRCPEFWTWNYKTGDWYGIPDGKKKCAGDLPDMPLIELEETTTTMDFEEDIILPEAAMDL